MNIATFCIAQRSLPLVAVLTLALACGKGSRRPTEEAATGGEPGGGGGSAATAGSNSVGGDKTSAGAGSGGGEPGPVVEDRPIGPEWEPPFPLGTPGWKDSTEPYCPPQQGSDEAFDIWADDSAVYALASVTCNVLAGVECGKEGLTLRRNDGSGWVSIFDVPPHGESGAKLSGFPGGAPILRGGFGGVSGIFAVEEGEARLLTELSDFRATFRVAGPAEGYVFDGPKLRHYDGATFSDFADIPFEALGMFASEELVVVGGLNQEVFVATPDSPRLEPVAGAPAGGYFVLWAFALDDIWAGNGAGQLLHYDGNAWAVLDTTDTSDDPAVLGLWGADSGELYFHTQQVFGRVTDGVVEPLFQLDNSGARFVGVRSMWGRSASEVFLTVSDSMHQDYACGGKFALWFDGAELHRF